MFSFFVFCDNRTGLEGGAASVSERFAAMFHAHETVGWQSPPFIMVERGATLKSRVPYVKQSKGEPVSFRRRVFLCF